LDGADTDADRAMGNGDFPLICVVAVKRKPRELR
jgi:hypothetical protein